MLGWHVFSARTVSYTVPQKTCEQTLGCTKATQFQFQRRDNVHTGFGIQAGLAVEITVAWKVGFVVLAPIFSVLFPARGTDSEGGRRLGSLTPTSLKEMFSPWAFCQAGCTAVYLLFIMQILINKWGWYGKDLQMPFIAVWEVFCSAASLTKSCRIGVWRQRHQKE